MSKPKDNGKRHGNQLPIHRSHPVPAVVEITTNESTDEDSLEKKKRLAFALKLIERGEVAKAYRVIVSDTFVQHYSAEGLAFLESKLPAPRNGGAAED